MHLRYRLERIVKKKKRKKGTRICRKSTSISKRQVNKKNEKNKR